MDAQRHLQLLAHGPDGVPVRLTKVRQVAQLHRHAGEDHPSVSHGDGPADLRDGRLDRAQRHDALRDEALAGPGPLLDQPVVVGLDARKLQLRVLQPPETLSGHPRHGRQEHRIVDPGRVHHLQPLGRNVRRPRHLVPPLGFPAALRHQRSRPRNVSIEQDGSVGHPLLPTVPVALDVGHPLPEAVPRQARRPQVRRLLDVVVDADQAILALHPCSFPQTRTIASTW